MKFLERHGQTIAIAAILVLAAWLRLSTISWGAPYVVNVDEHVIVDRAVAMIKTGDFNPHFWDYPGLTYYVQAAVASVRFLSGAMNREWVKLEDAWEGDFYLSARKATAWIGILTVFLVYRAGLRFGSTAALVAAIAMAVQPQHVVGSFWALTDVPLTFFVMLTLVQSMSAARSGRPWEFFLAGAAAGLATATKYNGVIAIIMPLCALAGTLPGIRPRLAAITAALGGMIAGFLLGAPFSLIDLPSFLNGFAKLMQYYNAELPAMEIARGYFMFMLLWFGWPGSLPLWIGIPRLLLCGFGFAAVATRLRSRDERSVALAVLAFPPVYFWFISNQSLQFGRYALPLAPFLAIAFGVGIAVLAQILQQRLTSPIVRRVAIAALFLPLLPPLGYTMTLNASRKTVSPSEQAARWLVANVRTEEGVAIEGRAMLQLPRRIKVVSVNQIIEHSLDRYQADGVVYLVTSPSEYQPLLDNPARNPNKAAAYISIFRTTQQVIAFESPNTNFMPTIIIRRVVN